LPKSALVALFFILETIPSSPGLVKSSAPPCDFDFRLCTTNAFSRVFFSITVLSDQPIYTNVLFNQTTCINPRHRLYSKAHCQKRITIVLLVARFAEAATSVAYGSSNHSARDNHYCPDLNLGTFSSSRQAHPYPRAHVYPEFIKKLSWGHTTRD
jgi:hypothetical protein